MTLLLLIAFFLVRGLQEADQFASVLSLLFMIATQAYLHTKGTQPEASGAPAATAGATRSRRARHRRRITKPAAIVITVSLTSFSCTAVGPSSPDNRIPSHQCSIAAGTPGTIAPSPARARGLVFCPVQIDDGTGPIRGPFMVTSQVIGRAAPAGSVLALFIRIDPETCDAAGEHGRQGYYLLDQVDLRAADAGWSYVDNFGDFPPGITFGRIYEYATMSRESLLQIKQQRSVFGGLDIEREELPEDVRFLSRFDVPPGAAEDQVPCRW